MTNPIVVDVGDQFRPFVERFLPEGESLVAADDVLAAGGTAEVLVTFLREQQRERSAALIGDDTRWVHILSTGVDNTALDLVPDGVTVTCSRGASAEAISEWCLAMMLAHAKRLPGTWLTEPTEQWNFAQLASLDGATVGLLGVGSISTWVARRLAGFDTRILGYRRRALPAADPRIEIVTSLSDVLAQSDHLVVAAAATPATRHILDADAFAQVKPGLHLVNVARGSLVDQDALRAALDDGRVARASLDVVDPEPLPAGHWLYAHPQVDVSAHVSWSAPITMHRIIEGFTANVPRHRAGEPLEGVVDLEAGY
ncbi:MAG: NAD(P)-dependent oxidoreductase [Acidimicrobiia bacterium]